MRLSTVDSIVLSPPFQPYLDVARRVLQSDITPALVDEAIEATFIALKQTPLPQDFQYHAWEAPGEDRADWTAARMFVILYLRGERNMRIHEIGSIFSISTERVRQIQEKAIAILSPPFQEYLDISRQILQADITPALVDEAIASTMTAIKQNPLPQDFYSPIVEADAKNRVTRRLARTFVVLYLRTERLMRLREIGEILSISRERVRQIQEKAIAANIAYAISGKPLLKAAMDAFLNVIEREHVTTIRQAAEIAGVSSGQVHEYFTAHPNARKRTHNLLAAHKKVQADLDIEEFLSDFFQKHQYYPTSAELQKDKTLNGSIIYTKILKYHGGVKQYYAARGIVQKDIRWAVRSRQILLRVVSVVAQDGRLECLADVARVCDIPIFAIKRALSDNPRTQEKICATLLANKQRGAALRDVPRSYGLLGVE